MAAEKKHCDVYNGFKVYMDFGRYLSKKHQDDKALGFYKYAEEVTKGQASLGKVFIELAKMNCALGNLSEAREDINNGLKFNPGDLEAICTDAHTCFQEDKYEECLIKNIQGSFRRKIPDYFIQGIRKARGTVEDTIGYNAGNFTSMNVLGPSIVQVKLAEKDLLPTPPPISELERRIKEKAYNIKRRCISEKYLGPVAKQKVFLEDSLDSTALSVGLSSKNYSLGECIQNGLDRIKRKEESLWRRKPLYVHSNLAAKPSPKLRVERRELMKLKMNLLQQEFERELECIKNLMQNKEWSKCFIMAENLRGKLYPISKKRLPKKKQYLNVIYTTVGQMYLSMKTFVRRWSVEKNDERLLYMLGDHRPYKLVIELYRDSIHSKIINDKEFLDKMMDGLNESSDSLEKIYFLNELACFYSLNDQTELMRISARNCLFEAKNIGNIAWYINSIFLLARAEVQESNIVDAKVTLFAARSTCNMFGMREQAAFATRALHVLGLEKPKTLEKDDGPIAKREELLVHLMVDNDLKCRATTLIQKMNNLPPLFRMSIIPGLKPTMVNKSVRQKQLAKETAVMKDVVGSLNRRKTYQILPGEFS